MKKPWTSMTSNSIIMRAMEDPIAAAVQCCGEVAHLEFGYQKRLYEILEGCVAIAERLDDKWDDWVKFVHLPFWEKVSRKPRRDNSSLDKLKWVLTFVFQAASKPLKDRVWKYNRVLADLRKKGVPVSEMAERIQSGGGFEAVLTEVTKNDPRRLPKHLKFDDPYYDTGETESGGDDSGDDSEADSLDLDESDVDDNKPNASERSGNSQSIRRETLAQTAAQRPYLRSERFGGLERLELYIRRDQLDYIMEMAAEGRGCVIFDHIDDEEDGWRNFKVARAKLLKRKRSLSAR